MTSRFVWLSTMVLLAGLVVSACGDELKAGDPADPFIGIDEDLVCPDPAAYCTFIGAAGLIGATSDCTSLTTKTSEIWRTMTCENNGASWTNQRYTRSGGSGGTSWWSKSNVETGAGDYPCAVSTVNSSTNRDAIQGTNTKCRVDTVDEYYTCARPGGGYSFWSHVYIPTQIHLVNSANCPHAMVQCGFQPSANNGSGC